MTFNPEKHLMDLNGKSYLEVKWRLVWFRSECPNGTIDTEEMEVDTAREVEAEVPTGQWIPNPNRPGKKMPEKVVKTARGYARFRAIVTDGKSGRATATKCENAASFDDYVEKAETGAVGRALAMLGYGTQFTGDELSEEHRIVDAPVSEGSNGHAPQGEVPNIAQLQAMCDEIMGPGKWKSVRAYVLDLTRLGDIPDELLDESRHLEDRRKLYRALLQKQEQKANRKAS